MNDWYTPQTSLYGDCIEIKDETQINVDDARVCQEFYEDPERFLEQKGPITVFYGNCEIKINETKIRTPCVTKYAIKKAINHVNEDGAIITYNTHLNQEITHRLQFIIESNGNKYYITKGDNNPLFDFQMKNIITETNNPPKKLRGKTVMKIPYLGKLRLWLSGENEDFRSCEKILIQG